MILTSLIAIVIGYLLGSISPSYFLGRILRGIDIRKVEYKNAGTTNTYKVLGLWPAAITATFDLGKGLLAVYIAWLLKVPELVMYAAGLFAIIGHIYPFYLNFRGGQGMATALALLAYSFVKITTDGGFTDIYRLLYSLIIALILVTGIYFITRRGEIIGVFCVPVFIVLLFLNHKVTWSLIFSSLLLLIIFLVQTYNVIKGRLLDIDKARGQILHWRNFARPFAIAFPIASFFVPRSIFLDVIGALAAFFIAVDLLRLLVARLNIFLYKKTAVLFKEKERKRFSSMTFFLTAIFIIFLAFPQNVAIPATLFLIFGDLAAKFFGLIFGRTPLLGKTLEGSVAYFIFSLVFGFVFSVFAPIPFWILILGAGTAAATELISIFGIDDNFTVGLISSALMFALIHLT